LTCSIEELPPFRAAEVRPFEELGREDHLGSTRRSSAHVGGYAIDVLVDRSAKRTLDRGDRHRASHGPYSFLEAAGACWVMQWNAPPPRRMMRASTPTVRRPGNNLAMARTASSSQGDP